MKQNIKFFLIIELIILLICSFSVNIIILKAGGWKFSSIYIHIWAVTPYITFLIITLCLYINNKNETLIKSACIISTLMLLISLVIYIDGLFYHSSSLSILLFYYIPIYLIFGGPIALAIFAKVLLYCQRKNQ